MKYGFQSSYGYFDGQIDPYTHEYKTETELTDRRSWHRNDEYLDESGTHVTDLITAEAIRIIEEERDEPFFLYVAHQVRPDRNTNNTELYDLENDFRENNNVSSANPEIVEQMKDLLEKFIEGDRSFETAPMAL